MPKGRVTARTVTCKACGNEFVSDRVGKASYYCHTPQCDELRKKQKLVVKNTGEWSEHAPRAYRPRRPRALHDELILRAMKPGRKNVTDVLVKTELRLQRDIERMEARFDRQAERQRAKEHRAWQRQQTRLARREAREQEKREAREAKARRKSEEKRLATIRAKTRKRGLECFAQIFDDPDQMILYFELMEVMTLAADTPGEQIEAKKALVRITRAESQEEQHRGWQLLAAVSLRMADRFRPRQDRDPHVAISDEDEHANDETLVAA